ncbi:MAG: lipid A phosphoethanolamine transferase [Spirochaetes bacterium]|nr:lipid A phosphoethanolamine transferase [Spirochaetota bacterium]
MIKTIFESLRSKWVSFINTKYGNIIVILIFSIIYSLVFNAIDFMRYPVKYGNTFLNTLLLFILTIPLVFYFFLVVSINKTLFTVVTLLTTFLSSMMLYFIIVYKVRIYLFDTFILLLQTNPHEAKGVLSFDLVIMTLTITLCAALFLYAYNKFYNPAIGKQIKIILIFILSPILLVLYFSRPVMPYAFFYAINMYNKYQTIIHQPRTDISKLPSFFNKEKNSDLTVVFIIGEAARADHFSINGYTRKTSPNLEKLQVVSLPNIDSIYGVTNKSVPLMMTRATKEKEDITYKETSFVSLFNKHGFTTAWISNQDLIDNSYSNIAAFANEASIKKQIIWNKKDNKNFSVTNASILDENMLPELDELMKIKNRKLIILHCMGSHWEFHKHYPDTFRKYMPICTTSNVSRCNHDELINNYDNSILYADYFISEVIRRLQNTNAIVIYCSDHGEFLGEDGYYGHIPGIHRKEITNPAMFVWMSDEYKKRNPEKYTNLLKNKNKHLPTYIIFHSILDAASIYSKAADYTLSIFSKM